MNVIEICDEIERYGQEEYDRGHGDADETCRSECEDLLADAIEEARLSGFEEGHDEAELVFKKEGIEDVKTQAWDLGFRASQSKMDAKKELWQQAGYDAGYGQGYIDGRDAGWKNGLKAGRESGRKAAELDAASAQIRRERHGGHGC